jgi:hypothetical protein
LQPWLSLKGRTALHLSPSSHFVRWQAGFMGPRTRRTLCRQQVPGQQLPSTYWGQETEPGPCGRGAEPQHWMLKEPKGGRRGTGVTPGASSEGGGRSRPAEQRILGWCQTSGDVSVTFLHFQKEQPSP